MMQVIGYSKLALIRTLIAVTLPLMLMHMAIDEYVGPTKKKLIKPALPGTFWWANDIFCLRNLGAFGQ